MEDPLWDLQRENALLIAQMDEMVAELHELRGANIALQQRITAHEQENVVQQDDIEAGISLDTPFLFPKSGRTFSLLEYIAHVRKNDREEHRLLTEIIAEFIQMVKEGRVTRVT